jgi:hypothetical protein
MFLSLVVFYVNTNSVNVFIIFAAEGDLDYSGGEILAELQAYWKNEPVLDGVVTRIQNWCNQHVELVRPASWMML